MKKKKVSGEHKTPRKTVQIPEDWLRFAQRMAARRPLPVMWLLIELLRKEGESSGEKDIPITPWALPDEPRKP